MGALIACSVAAAGCASTKVSRMAAEPPRGEYRIGKEDVIEVVVFREPELSRVVPVRPDGKISLPLAGEMDAAGKTAAELQGGIAKVLAAYVREPAVSVLVREINASRVFVLGEVVRPGGFPLRGPMTVVQAIAIAGGRTPYAGDRVVWLREKKDGKTEKATLSFRDLVKGEESGELWLASGDVLYVP
ncbi:MAG TPA: polysaccharide biosynthesis/export family protein [Anaeromyxobacter sp.]|nr:polysaccharide biosynthesis/export family protein [Anaeromyxobacter sp.]